METRSPSSGFVQAILNAPENLQLLYILVKDGWITNEEIMNKAIIYNKQSLVLFMIENGYNLYNVKTLRSILEKPHSFSESIIDKYIEKGIDFNNSVFYEPILVEDYTYYYMNYDSEDSGNSSDDEEETEKGPYIHYIYQPLLYFTQDIVIIKKLINAGIDLEKNMFCDEWGCLKKAIDYGRIKLVLELMTYIPTMLLNDEEWWYRILNHISQDGNTGTGPEKCYQILCEREKMLYSGLLPSRKIYDRAKLTWGCTRIDNPGEFRD